MKKLLFILISTFALFSCNVKKPSMEERVLEKFKYHVQMNFDDPESIVDIIEIKQIGDTIPSAISTYSRVWYQLNDIKDVKDYLEPCDRQLYDSIYNCVYGDKITSNYALAYNIKVREMAEGKKKIKTYEANYYADRDTIAIRANYVSELNTIPHMTVDAIAELVLLQMKADAIRDSISLEESRAFADSLSKTGI